MGYIPQFHGIEYFDVFQNDARPRNIATCIPPSTRMTSRTTTKQKNVYEGEYIRVTHLAEGDTDNDI